MQNFLLDPQGHIKLSDLGLALACLSFFFAPNFKLIVPDSMGLISIGHMILRVSRPIRTPYSFERIRILRIGNEYHRLHLLYKHSVDLEDSDGMGNSICTRRMDPGHRTSDGQ